MYHRIVASKVRATFDEISAGRWEAMVDGMAPRFTYRFYGEHALSGERHTTAALRLWWQRSLRLLPNTTFQVEDVVVSGWPWSTKVATRVRVSAPLPDGTRYENVFMQFIAMRWARITEVHTLEDTVVLQRALDALAAAGVAEAHAEPITDASAEHRAAVG
ncbi:nuclear transport factor 2 family protein [Goodfellowiella coeruleoviolacea]|uniref:Ketosteroid isomerase-related protein n=1 Tax=Goodfellowiella coeruleoviolacea TaxID=334858 RepID=A0AAE3KDN3_9PSEU|nr:nuclear transport factor 2 family protein [Goodfellowiella coeruleoviolacea]MCP2164256.1 Ketosteroid isomerase-related protein [Goodfellowiella coeruleoviolacea]